MSTRPFRFGLNVIPSLPKPVLQKVAQAAEDLGYDILTVSDYLTLDLPPAGIAAWTAAKVTAWARS